ncbi:monocarboxylate transporter 12 [Plakobranchus ocellatus]|uniref:Monocarboxylate transporter 12 n=1 Tax=Plakobranchus ocellatus TaxID=259542 RepID=A0AAV4D4A8_9GAST|nr:monocarboxylate transporter 12 [Plakobranchus ocellatus]
MTRFSYRNIALFGSALVTIGLLGMPYLPYIPAMCLLFGVLTGFGNCCTYIPSHVLSGLYYDKYRSIATGISTSGSGLGSAAVPVLVGLLIEIYSWRGSLIFVAGLNLHLFIFSALLRYPTDVDDVRTKVSVSTDRVKKSPVVDSEAKDPPSVNVGHETEEQLCLVTPKKYKLGCGRAGLSLPQKSRSQPERTRSSLSGSESYHGKTEYENFAISLSDSDFSNTQGLKTDGGCTGKNVVNLDEPKVMDKTNLGNLTENRIEKQKDGVKNEERDSGVIIESESYELNASYYKKEHRKTSESIDKYHQDEQKLSAVQFLPISRSISSRSLFAMGSRGSAVIYYETTPFLPGMQTSIVSTSSAGGESTTTSVISKIPISSRHIYIFTNYGFDIYFFSNIMWNSSYAIIQCFAPEFLQEKGMTLMGAAWLSGAFGMSSFLGGILGGIVGNIDGVNRQRLYTLSCMVMGVATSAFALANEVYLFIVSLVLAGLSLGIILGLLIVVLTDLVGIESLGNGLGYLMLSNGVGTFLGPPMASILKDRTGSFRCSMYLAGALSVVGGLIMLLMPCKRFCCTRLNNSSDIQCSKHFTRDNCNKENCNPCCKQKSCTCIKQRDIGSDFELMPL